MKSPEQLDSQADKMVNSPEGKGELQSAIQTLRTVAEQLKTLESEADALLAKKDAVGHTAKLKERANLLVGLSDRLTSSLEKVDQEIKQQILYHVSCFEIEAKRALESEGFALQVLLMQMGDKINDMNALEKLIKFLESK